MVTRCCNINSCNKKHYAKGYCRRHYEQVSIHGKVLEYNKRSDPNKIVERDGICYMSLYNNTGDVIATTIFDAEHRIRVEKHKWSLSNSYARNNVKGFLHIFLFPDAPKDMIRDHINRNRLDNRNSNVRFVSPSQNNQNIAVKNKTGYRGVYKKRDKWGAKITINRSSIYLGLFDTPEDAARAYNKEAFLLYGEHAAINTIKGECHGRI